MVRAALDDIEHARWGGLRPRLHPYLHWRRPDGRVIRGRRNVLAEIEANPPTAAPSSYEVRDGQIYRWSA